MNMEKNRKNRSPQHDGGGMLAQVQASVEILSPVPLGGKCGEKDYERLFIREADIDHVLTHHFNQCEEAIKSLYARNYDAVF